VLGDVDRLPDHLGVDERLDRDGIRLMASGAQGDTGEAAQSDDRGGCGNS